MNNDNKYFIDVYIRLRRTVMKRTLKKINELNLSKAEASLMKLRAEVILHTSQYVKELGLTQSEVAKKLKITQPRVSRLLKGKVEDFSLDMLFTLAIHCNLKPVIGFEHTS